MKVSNTCIYKPTVAILLAGLITGCDQIAKVTSGVGWGEKTASEDRSPPGASEQNDDEEKTAPDSSSDAVSTDTEDDADEDEGADDDAGAADSALAGGPVDDRNIDQYPRLPRNVTWKPISSSSGGNLTIVLWGGGGGEKNYAEGSLRIEHNDGVTYPRTYVRRDDPNNGERAPKFYFDVQGSWFAGKDPVLFWNLGAYRVVHPEKRQGKHEE